MLSSQDKLNKLIKVMNMTTSSNDGEVLNAIRMANKIIKAEGLDWTGVLAMSIKKENESFSSASGHGYTEADVDDAMRYNRYSRAEQYQRHNHKTGSSYTVKKMFEDLSDKEFDDRTTEFLTSLWDYYKSRGRLSDKQFTALARIHREHAGT